MVTTPDFGPHDFLVTLVQDGTITSGPPTTPGGWNLQSPPTPGIPPLPPQRDFDQMQPNPVALYRVQHQFRRDLREWVWTLGPVNFVPFQESVLLREVARSEDGQFFEAALVREVPHSADGQLYESVLLREVPHGGDGQLYESNLVREVLLSITVAIATPPFTCVFPIPSRVRRARQDFIFSRPQTLGFGGFIPPWFQVFT